MADLCLSLKDFSTVAFARIDLDGNACCLRPSCYGKGRHSSQGCHQLLNDHRPMNFSGMVAHTIICWLEKVLNAPRSFSLKSLGK